MHVPLSIGKVQCLYTELIDKSIFTQVPHIFGDLVHLMRSLDYSDLRDMDRQLQRNNICSDNALKTRLGYYCICS